MQLNITLFYCTSDAPGAKTEVAYSIDAAVLWRHHKLQFHSFEAVVLVVKTREVMRRRICESTDAGECRRKWMQGITGWGNL